MNEYVEERVPGPAAQGRTKSVALSIDAVYRQGGHAVVGSGGLLRQERTQVPTHGKDYFEKRGQSDADSLLAEAGVDRGSTEEFYRLSPEETYFVEFAEAPPIPGGYVGVVSPQETLLRAGVTLQASLVGPDDDGIEGLLTVDGDSVLLQESSSVAELVVVEPAG